jgi:hypothetical protein
MSLACIFVLGLDQADWLKLMGIATAMVALYIIARRLGGGDETVPPPSEVPAPIETQIPTMEPPDGGYPEVEDLEQVDYEPEVTEAPKTPQPRNIRIINWNFEHFDLSAGPPDPNSFADYLWMELFDASTGHAWKQSRFVATPAGIAKMLHKDEWGSMEIPQTIVMARYDLKELRAAVLDQLGAIEATRGDVPPEDIDAAAAGGS